MTDFKAIIIADTHHNNSNKVLEQSYLENIRKLKYNIDQLKPDFIIHLGDIAQKNLTEANIIKDASSFYKAYPVDQKWVFTPGNHDITSSSLIDKYMEFYGSLFGKIREDETTLCVKVDSSRRMKNDDIDKQIEFIKNINIENKTLIIFTHIPPFIHTLHENNHPDNWDRKVRIRLFDFFSQQKNKILFFSGHTHHFFCNQHKNVFLYSIPSLQSYSSGYNSLNKSSKVYHSIFILRKKNRALFLSTKLFSLNHKALSRTKKDQSIYLIYKNKAPRLAKNYEYELIKLQNSNKIGSTL